jgi:hypothetical protein
VQVVVQKVGVAAEVEEAKVRIILHRLHRRPYRSLCLLRLFRLEEVSLSRGVVLMLPLALPQVTGAAQNHLPARKSSQI